MQSLRVMDDGARKWMMKQARKNYWRVARFLDLDDLFQEGYFVYYHVLSRYPNVKDRPHIMRLFQIAFINHITTLAKRQTRELDTVLALSPPSLPAPYVSPVPMTADPSTILEIVAMAPKCVRDLLKVLATSAGAHQLRKPYKAELREVKVVIHDPLWFWDPTPRYRKYEYRHRETFNERLCGLIGVDPATIDMPKLLIALFS